jgi:hypothetical protein
MPPKRKSIAGSETPAVSGSSAKRSRTSAASSSPAPTPTASRGSNTKWVYKSRVKVYKPAELCTYVAKAISDNDENTAYKTLQRTTCQRWTAAQVNDQCMSCIEKQAACGTCRFLQMRVFRETVDENGKTVVDYTDYAFKGNQNEPIEPPKPPKTNKRENKKNKPARSARRRAGGSDSEDSEEEKELAWEVIPKSGRTYPTPALAAPLSPTPEDAAYVLPIVASAFACHMRRENWHEETHMKTLAPSQLPGGSRPMIRIQCTPLTRSLCDVCSTSIYMGSYMCGCCGRELCLGCWEEWTPSGQLYSGRLNRIDQCSRKRRHGREAMLFVTRGKEGEIQELLQRVITHISQENFSNSTDHDDEVIARIPKTTASCPYPNGPRYLPVPRTKHSDLPLQDFQCLWRKGGIPLVLTGLLAGFQLPWDAQYFIDEHGEDECFIHDCTDDNTMEATVASFFSSFSGSLGTSYKIKDWPPSADFKDTFPKLFADFENALPYPTYTRRSGPLNLASHFPPGWNAPDLGPKMYNAYPAKDFLSLNEDALTPEHKVQLAKEVNGTTNLHLDLTDAVNIMLYTSGGLNAPLLSTTEKGIPLCGAIWDIFPPSAAATIRAYLKEKNEDVDDPIHRQIYYLSEHDLALLAQKGVGSYRIFQQPGDAVFIPAGCPHQVRNRRSCVKVAVDFLTAENVHVCRKLIEEARKMAPRVPKPGNKGMAKEDVLQLWTCLGFAWGALELVKDGRAGDRAGNGMKKEAMRVRLGQDGGLELTDQHAGDTNGSGNYNGADYDNDSSGSLTPLPEPMDHDRREEAAVSKNRNIMDRVEVVVNNTKKLSPVPDKPTNANPVPVFISRFMAQRAVKDGTPEAGSSGSADEGQGKALSVIDTINDYIGQQSGSSSQDWSPAGAQSVLAPLVINGGASAEAMDINSNTTPKEATSNGATLTLAATITTTAGGLSTPAARTTKASHSPTVTTASASKKSTDSTKETGSNGTTPIVTTPGNTGSSGKSSNIAKTVASVQAAAPIAPMAVPKASTVSKAGTTSPPSNPTPAATTTTATTKHLRTNTTYLNPYDDLW